MAEPIKLFFSYSHADAPYRDELEKHLSILKWSGVISTWHDRQIMPGQDWAGEIDRSLLEADIVLLLVSNDFVASGYCWQQEMQAAMSRHKRGETVVIPIMIRPVDYEGAPFAGLQALPRDARAVSTWENHDEAWRDVARGIRRVCLGLKPTGLPSADRDWHSLRTAAEDGETAAQLLVASSHRDGKSVERNLAEAARWLKLAAEQGDAEAQRRLGLAYRQGEGVGQELGEAARWFRLAAKQGDADAQYFLAEAYRTGEGVRQDSGEAVRWYRAAAEQGHAAAQCKLARAYWTGQGGEQNFDEAVRWFRLAADQGEADAQFFLGAACEAGNGLKQDFEEAVRWYRAAAEQGHVEARDRLDWIKSNVKGMGKLNFLSLFRRDS